MVEISDNKKETSFINKKPLFIQRSHPNEAYKRQVITGWRLIIFMLKDKNTLLSGKPSVNLLNRFSWFSLFASAVREVWLANKGYCINCKFLPITKIIKKKNYVITNSFLHCLFFFCWRFYWFVRMHESVELGLATDQLCYELYPIHESQAWSISAFGVLQYACHGK